MPSTLFAAPLLIGRLVFYWVWCDRAFRKVPEEERSLPLPALFGVRWLIGAVVSFILLYGVTALGWAVGLGRHASTVALVARIPGYYLEWQLMAWCLGGMDHVKNGIPRSWVWTGAAISLVLEGGTLAIAYALKGP